MDWRQTVIFWDKASFGNGNFPLLMNQILGEINAAYDDGEANGDLTSRQAGSIGGEMVKKMIMKQEEQMSNK